MEGDDPADLLFSVHNPFFSTGYLFFGSRALLRVVWHLCRPIPSVLIPTLGWMLPIPRKS